MALFNRTKKDSVLPEVEQYYEGERRDRAGLAWLLALVSIIVVALIIVGLFLAGRWAFNKITDDEENVAVNTTQDEETPAPSFDGTDNDSGSDDNSEDNADDTAGDDNDADEEDESTAEEETDNEGTVNAPARTDTPSVPVTGDDSELPNTGPANLVGVFAGVSTLAGGIHYAVTTRKRK